MRPTASVLLACLAFSPLVGCTTSTLRQKEAPKSATPEHASRTNSSKHYGGSNNAAEISRSRGEKGGVVVLWPRIIPKSDDPGMLSLAALVQSRLAAAAENLSPSVDKRPAPERVCERPQGCLAVSVGAVLTSKDKGCAVVALVGPAGAEPVKIVPWVGQVQIKKPEVGFRDPPENELTIVEFASCEELRKKLESNAPPGEEDLLTAAIKEALGR